MKKVKIMLTSIALIAVVGGALAFKAKYNMYYCTAPTRSGGTCPQVCPNIAENSWPDPFANVEFVCTTTSYANAVDKCKDIHGFAPFCGGFTVKLTMD